MQQNFVTDTSREPEQLAMYSTYTMTIVGAVSFSIMGQRRRRWPNIETALAECLV